MLGDIRCPGLCSDCFLILSSYRFDMFRFISCFLARNLRMAYVAQHAFHHLEEHLEETAVELEAQTPTKNIEEL